MDITTAGKLNRFIKNLSKRVSDHPLITSVVLCLLFFLLAVIFCEPKYETNNDYGVDMILSGVLTG